MFLKYITLISGFNFLLLSIVLLFKKASVKKNNNLILGFIFFILALYTIQLSLYNTALIEKDYIFLGHYYPVDYLLIALMGPAIYVYIKTLLNKPLYIRSAKVWFHALPIIPPLIFLGYFISLSKMDRIELLIANFEKGIWPVNVLNVFFYIQMTVYLWVCYRIVKLQLSVSPKITYGDTQIDISWLKNLMIIDLTIMCVSAPLCFYLGNERVSNTIAQLAMDIQLIYIFFKSVWQTGVFPGEQIMEVKSKESMLKIADEVVDDYFKVLMTFMEQKKPYLLEDCNIQSVSEQTNISVHHLSNILNKRFDKSFPEFINHYRIIEARKILDSQLSEKMTLEAIGYECGFGSKSSFNKAFKKITNFTPSEYRIKSKS